MPLTFNYVSLVVADLERALSFYRLLGLPIPAGAHLNAEGLPEDHVEVTQGGLRIAWETETLTRQLTPGWSRPAGQSVGLGLEAASPGDVNAACEQVRAAGFTVITAPYDAFWGQRYATLQDPDGYSLDVFAWLAPAQLDPVS